MLFWLLLGVYVVAGMILFFNVLPRYLLLKDMIGEKTRFLEVFAGFLLLTFGWPVFLVWGHIERKRFLKGK